MTLAFIGNNGTEISAYRMSPNLIFKSIECFLREKMKRVLVAWLVRLQTLILIRNHLDTAEARSFPSAHIKIG